MSSLLDEMPTKNFVSEGSPQEGELEIGGFDGINSNLDNVTGGLDSNRICNGHQANSPSNVACQACNQVLCNGAR